MVTPDALTLDNAATLVSQAAVTATCAEALAYVRDGDMWQDGRAWVGPRPAGNEPGATLINEEIRRGLAAANLARELVERHVAGVLGREPTWEVLLRRPDAATMTDATTLEGADAEALVGWWDRLGLIALLRDALTRALCGETPVLRLLIPQPPLGRPASLSDALDHIAVEVLASEVAREIRDDGAALRLAVAVFDAESRTLAGMLGLAPPRRVAEIVYLEGDLTVVRQDGLDVGEDAEPSRLPLGGRLTMHALDDVPTLLTPSQLGMQRQLTLTLSCMGRNTVTAGFVERVFLNARRPTDADGNPLPYKAGAGMTNWVVGIQDADGSYTPPSLFTREPTPPASFTATADALVFHAHKEARQLHALLAGDASPSGESRRQAAADFVASLGPSARATERAIRWLLETAYALALALRGQAISPETRAAVQMTLSAGVATVEEIKEAREGVGAGLLARARYQAAAGVDDPDAEDQAIDGEQEPEPVAPQPAPVVELVAQDGEEVAIP